MNETVSLCIIFKAKKERKKFQRCNGKITEKSCWLTRRSFWRELTFYFLFVFDFSFGKYNFIVNSFGLIDRLIDFIGMSTCQGLFYGKRFGKCKRRTFIFTAFFMLLFLNYMMLSSPIEYPLSFGSKYFDLIIIIYLDTVITQLYSIKYYDIKLIIFKQINLTNRWDTNW